MLDSISYCSRGTPDLDGESFRQIISVARRNNAIHGITGLLVFGGGLYFQWLEGPPKALQNVMVKIRQDPRHDSLVILGNNFNEPERVFPNWDMEAVGREQVHEVLVDAIGSIKTETNGALLELLLDHVRRVDGALP